MAAPPLIFLSYLLTELLVFALSMRRYRWWLAKDRKEQLDNEEETVLYMTIRPEDAVEASRSLSAFADENGYNLCLETNASENVPMYERFGFRLMDTSVFKRRLWHYVMVYDGKEVNPG